MWRIASVHVEQKVHSWLQMNAGPSLANVCPHLSHRVRISSATTTSIEFRVTSRP